MLFSRKSKKPVKKGKVAKPAKNATSLDRRQQALRDAEEKLRKHQEQLERIILEAPKLREEKDRKRREQLSHDPRLSRTTLVDTRTYNATTASPAFGSRRLRSEKREGFYLFFFLIAVLGSIVFWIFKLLL